MDAYGEQLVYKHRSVDASPCIYTPIYCTSRINIVCDAVRYLRFCSSDIENLCHFVCDAESLI